MQYVQPDTACLDEVESPAEDVCQELVFAPASEAENLASSLEWAEMALEEEQASLAKCQVRYLTPVSLMLL